ncbi:tyrosine-type recombinase/integrase [Shewanella sp. 5_MG-2023]|uniref:site-specific integrase n=1 Tax=Shewanella sp. 5_MG-2023 TaxID=3062656 RepID=UPI0026E1E632|nr:tyrosine-type recombinase/integrase [Shewanella sp. 5_MG-2023]MDO6640849.1 tyrosine-type recombinase/integrase [Shewanella sp. 5_MG-2023]
MYLFRATNCTYYTRMVLPVYLRDKGFSADIKVSLLTKQRSIAIGRNLVIAGILRPIISSLTPQSNTDEFKSKVNGLINDARQGFMGITETQDEQAKPVREMTSFIPTRPTQMAETIDSHPYRSNPKLTRADGNKTSIKSADNITLNGALTKFIASKRKQIVSALTVKQLNQRIGHFIERTHLDDVCAVTSAEAMEYKDCLLEEGRSHKSNKDYLAAVSQFFKWCKLMRYTTENPFDEVKLTKPANQAGHDLARLRWQPSQIKQVLHSTAFIDKSHDFKWITLLMMYGGLRPAEACQLHTHDIAVKDGISVMTITNAIAGQKVKTEQSKRKVPIHHQLIELGFMEFVKTRADRTSKTKPIFNYKPSHDGNWSLAFCREFGKLLDNLNFISGKRPTAYSFRHTFIDELKQLQVEESLVAQIVGHAYQNITYGRYGKKFDVKTLQPVVDKINFELTISAES